MGNNTQGRSNRGFASMDYQKQREIASKGGRAAHQQGTAHEFTSEEAREAGRKGGEVVSRDRSHMAQIGRKGGEARSAASKAARSNGQNGQQEVSRQGINAAQGVSAEVFVMGVCHIESERLVRGGRRAKATSRGERVRRRA